jgi:hypothetical protein
VYSVRRWCARRLLTGTHLRLEMDWPTTWIVRGLLEKKVPKSLSAGFVGCRKLRLAVLTDVDAGVTPLTGPGGACG